MRSSQRRRTLILIAGFTGLGAMLGVIAAAAYSQHLKQFERRNLGLMRSQLPVEVVRLEQWRVERESDLALVFEEPEVRRLLGNLGSAPPSEPTSRRLLRLFAAAHLAHPDYFAMTVRTPQGRTLWRTPPPAPPQADPALLESPLWAPVPGCGTLTISGGTAWTACTRRVGPVAVTMHIDATNGILPSLGGLAPLPAGGLDFYLARRTEGWVEVLDHDPDHPGRTRLHPLPPDGAVALALLSGDLRRGPDHFGNTVLAMTSEHDWLGWRLVGARELGSAISDSQTLAVVFGLLGAVGVGGAFLLLGRLMRAAEAEGAFAQTRLNSMLRHAPDAILLLDRSSAIVDANAAAQRLYGYSDSEFTAMTGADFRPEGDKEDARANIARAFATGEARFETVHVRKDGGTMDVSIGCRVVQAPVGPLLEVIIRDVSSEKEALRRARSKGALMEALAHCASDISRAASREGLTAAVCSRLVEMGGFVLASYHHPDADGRSLLIEAVRGAGASELGGARLSLETAEQAALPVVRAFKSGAPVTTERIGEDPNLEGYRDFSVRHAIRSHLALPVSGSGKTLGVLCLSSAQEVPCDPEVIPALNLLAQDLGYALANLVIAGEAAASRAELGHSRHMLDKINEALPTGIYIFDLEQKASTFVSPPLEKMLGYSAAEIYSAGSGFLTGRLHPGDIAVFSESTARLGRLKDGETAVSQYRLRVKSGDYRWFRSRDTVFERGADGAPRLILGSFEDCTEEVVARDAMAAALARARMLTQAVENAAESIVITDLSGIIQYVNPAAERATGYSAAEAVGRHTRVLKSGRQDREFYRGLWGTVLRGQVWHGTFVNKRKDGTLFEEEASIAPVKDESGRVTNFVAVKRDVSRERSLEDQLAQAQKLEAIGRLAGGVAHDFNNILTSILGYAQLAKEELPQDDPMRADLEEIEGGAARAADLTRQLLIFSRKQVVKPRLIDPAAVVGALQKMLHRIIGEHYKLHFTAETSGGFIKADPSQLEQIVMNFVVNSRDAMPGGGDIRVTLRDARLENPVAGLDGPVPAGSYAALAVADSGTGIPAAIREHIFEPFFTTKPAGQGTGLGLATVYGIVKQGGAFLSVDSTEGKGTSMTVYWPYSAEVPEPEDAAQERNIGGSESILLVEDEGAVRRLSERLLTWAGYSVTSCAGPEEALAKASTSHILLLTDVVMPGMSGKALAERLRELYPGLKVLYSSGYSDEIISKQGMLEPGARLLQKPFSKEALFKAVRETLDA